MVLDDLQIAWAQQGLKDMTSMSGLRQDVPQERQSDLTRLARSGARRIEPAEPEPPPAHSLGRVDEDVMGRSGQLVRPRSLDTGGVAGGVAGDEELVARLVVRLA